MRTAGELNCSIANAVVGVHRDLLGRGPPKARALIDRNVVVLVMEDALTRGEQVLVARGELGAAALTRRAFHEAIRAGLAHAVERQTGRKVLSCLSDHDFDADLVAEIFVLDRGGVEPEAPPARDVALVATALGRVHREHAGRGPTRAHAFARDNLLVHVLHDTMTPSERSLVATGRPGPARLVRRHIQATMRAQLAGVVEQLTGCRVVAVLGDNDVDPDLVVNVFVLDRPLRLP